MQYLLLYLKQRIKIILVYILFCTIFAIVFALYRIPVKAALYPALLCSALGIIIFIFDYKKSYKRHRRLLELQKAGAEFMTDFPSTTTAEGEDYQNIIQNLCDEQAELTKRMNKRYSEMIEYYTVWAHQIKTPIASMRLNLQNEDSEFARNVADDLQRIEQYVEMVMIFLRLDNGSTDYIIKEQDLDKIIKPAIKKFSTQFIRRKLSLAYQPLNIRAITDEKWLSFVIEQVLSNALKYTQKGTISITLKEPKTICISDTGIGIAPEDLPRVFEKGYTGYNGRNDKNASGIGLYLCKRICNNLGHQITITSDLNKGTTIYINLEQKSLEVE